MKQVWVTDKGSQCESEHECKILEQCEKQAAKFFEGGKMIGLRNAPSYPQAVAVLYWQATNAIPAAYR